MKNIFLDSHGRLRNGWWVLIFIGFFLVSRIAYTPLRRGLKELGLTASALEALPFIFVLLVTWACVRLRREKLSSIGYRLDRCWLKEVSLGTLIGVSTALIAVSMMRAAGCGLRAACGWNWTPRAA